MLIMQRGLWPYTKKFSSGAKFSYQDKFTEKKNFAYLEITTFFLDNNRMFGKRKSIRLDINFSSLVDMHRFCWPGTNFTILFDKR